MIAELSSINEMRFKRISDELEAEAPASFRRLQLLSEPMIVRPRRNPAVLYRVQADPNNPVRTYRISRAYFETTPLTYRGEPVSDDMAPMSIPPNTRVYAKCSVTWDLATAAIRERIGGGPDFTYANRIFTYKTGSYSQLKAEVIFWDPDGDFPGSHISPSESLADDAAENGMRQPDYRYTDLGQVMSDGGVVSLGNHGQFFTFNAHDIAANYAF